MHQIIKFLYGLKQSPQLWYERLSSALKEFGCKRLESSEFVFSREGVVGKVIIAVYVDELIIMSARKPNIEEAKVIFLKGFKLEDSGELSYYLVLKFLR